jgi:peroxiredoxin
VADWIRRKIRGAREYADDADMPSARDDETTSLRAGDYAPDFRLSDTDGRVISLSATLKSGPVVLCFLDARDEKDRFAELEAFGQYAEGIEKLGASLLGLSSDPATFASPTAQFKALVDTGGSVASAYGLCPPAAGTRPAAATAPERSSQADEANIRGPVPATFLIDQRSRIVLSLVDAAFDSEIVPLNVMGALQALRRR